MTPTKQMRSLSLEELHAELLRIAVTQFPINPEFDKILREVRRDLDKRREWRIEGMEPDIQYPLSNWWSGYPGLGTYIRE